ncbi:hypothetical protein RJJ37_29670 [Rhizobium redzepovicii]|uniref:Uncharacterized protein n=1 Tax=Rhizobium redzepovicii TaxID=2867518 RepID=A0AAW8P9K9_9HYPH|nr:hypothetical protein [Rhizobium redzepovicii]MDR9763749.1 hypothetical protein [Rhizobium redzepovicii]
MSRYEFAIRLLAEGAAATRGGTYSAGTLMMASALFSSMPPGTLIRMGDGGSSTADDLRMFRIVARRQSGNINEKDRDGSGPWPHHACGVRDFLAREVVRYIEEIREPLMSERRAAGLPNHDYQFVTSAADSSEIAAPYSLSTLDGEFRRALGVMEDRYPESHSYYEVELSSVDKLVSFLRWTITPSGRIVDDPLNDVQASMLLYLNSPLRIQAGDAMRYIEKITDVHPAKGKLPGLGN